MEDWNAYHSHWSVAIFCTVIHLHGLHDAHTLSLRYNWFLVLFTLKSCSFFFNLLFKASHLNIPCSWADGVDGQPVLAIVVEYSVAFWMLTRGRCRCVPFETDVAFDAHEFVVVADAGANVDGVESNNNCCTCRISTYSSSPDGLTVLFSLESLIELKWRWRNYNAIFISLQFQGKKFNKMIFDLCFHLKLNNGSTHHLGSCCYCNNYRWRFHLSHWLCYYLWHCCSYYQRFDRFHDASLTFSLISHLTVLCLSLNIFGCITFETAFYFRNSKRFLFLVISFHL